MPYENFALQKQFCDDGPGFEFVIYPQAFVFAVNIRFLMESLILAQDERLRRA